LQQTSTQGADFEADRETELDAYARRVTLANVSGIFAPHMGSHVDANIISFYAYVDPDFDFEGDRSTAHVRTDCGGEPVSDMDADDIHLCSTVADILSNMDSDFDAEFGSNKRADIHADMGSNIDAHLVAYDGSNVDTYFDANVISDFVADLSPNVDAYVYADIDANIDTNFYSHLDANVHSNIESNSDADLVSHVDADFHADFEADFDTKLFADLGPTHGADEVFWNNQPHWFSCQQRVLHLAVRLCLWSV